MIADVADEAMPDWTVGAVLVAGFLGMLLLDQLQHKVGSEHGHGHGHGRGTPHLHSSDDDLEEGALSAGASPSRGVGKVSCSSGPHLHQCLCHPEQASPSVLRFFHAFQDESQARSRLQRAG